MVAIYFWIKRMEIRSRNKIDVATEGLRTSNSMIGVVELTYH